MNKPWNKRQLTPYKGNSPVANALDLAEVGLIHAPGLDVLDAETLCGFSLTGVTFVSTQEPVTCPNCIRGLRQCAQLLRGRRVKP